MISMKNDEPVPKGLSVEFWRIPYNRYLYKQCKDLKIMLRDINRNLISREEPVIVIIDDDDEEVEEMIISDDENNVQYRLPISRNVKKVAQTTINVANTIQKNHINIEFIYPDFKDCFTIDTQGQLQSYEQQSNIEHSSAKALEVGQINVCCWYRREAFLKDLLIDSVINDLSFKFMRTRHQCLLDKCLCCQECKQIVLKIDTTNATTTKNNVKLEHMISVLYNKRPRIPVPRTKMHAENMNKVRQKYCNNVVITNDKRLNHSVPEVVKRKSFKNTTLMISKILPNDAKDIEIYIIGKNMTDVSCHLFLNHKDTESPLSSLSKTHNSTRSKLYSYNICCWFEREELINRLSKTSGAPIEELDFLKKKHFCLFKPSCDCCCKEKHKESTIDNEENPNVDNDNITEEALLEDEIKIEIEEEVLLPQDPLQINEGTEPITPLNVNSPEIPSASFNNPCETDKGDYNEIIDEPPNQVHIDKHPNQASISKAPNHLINPKIQIKSSFLKALLDSEAPLKFPSNDKTQPNSKEKKKRKTSKEKPINPNSSNKIAVSKIIENLASNNESTAIENLTMNNERLAKADPPVPVLPNEQIPTNDPIRNKETIDRPKRNVASITMEIIELRLKTFRSELLKLASLTDSHVKKVINDGFQNMLDNLNPDKIAEPEKEVPNSEKRIPEIVEDRIEFAEDLQQPLEDESKNEPLSCKSGPARKVFSNRNDKTIPFKTSKIRKRKRPFRTEHIDEFNYNIYCDKLNNFYKKLHL